MSWTPRKSQAQFGGCVTAGNRPTEVRRTEVLRAEKQPEAALKAPGRRRQHTIMRARIRIALLQVVGMLVAVSCSHGPTVQETVHNTDKRISVVSINTLPTSIGPVVVGEVRNASGSPVDGVQIAVSLTDRAGQAIGNQFGFTLLKVLRPGAKAPFSIPYTG